MIDECRRKFFERQPFLGELRQELNQRIEDDHSIRIAASILLSDFEQGHLWQARDRAVCEAAALGLHAAVGDATDLGTNPITGSAYRIARENDQIVIWGIYPPREDEVWRIPLCTRTARRDLISPTTLRQPEEE